MSIIEELTDYLDAKKAYEEYEPDPGEYSPWKAQLYERLSKAHLAFDKALDRLIADRIESATGARP